MGDLGSGGGVAGGIAEARLDDVAAIVASGRIGRVALARYSLRLESPADGDADAQALWAALMHGVRIATEVSGAPPRSVFARVRGLPPASGARSRHGIAHLVLEGGAIGAAEALLSPAATAEERLLVVGTAGTVRIGDGADLAATLQTADGVERLWEAPCPPPRVTRGEAATEEDGLGMVRAALERSAATGEPVDVARPSEPGGQSDGG